MPFRDSKLTRILKDGLCGNSRLAVMVATVSGSSAQYEHTVNTLKYADRAKEIKTFVQANRGTVETHIVEYQRVIDQLREERRELKAEVERLKTNSDRDPVKDSESGSERRRTSQSSQSSQSSRPSSGSSAKTDDPIADVNELLLAAAAALPEGDALRAEAEALAARARARRRPGWASPRRSARGPSGGLEPKRGRARAAQPHGGDVFDGLQYATRVLNETVRLNRGERFPTRTLSLSKIAGGSENHLFGRARECRSDGAPRSRPSPSARRRTARTSRGSRLMPIPT